MGAHAELPARGAHLLKLRRVHRPHAARLRDRLLGAPCALIAAGSLVACAASPAQAPTLAAGANWSAPSTLSDCGGEHPQVVFPSEEPTHASGPGAIVWSGSAGCADGAGARVAQITSADMPRAGAPPRTGAGRRIAPLGPLAASGAPHGEIAVAGVSPSDARGGLAIQGRVGGAFAAIAPASGFSAPFALARGYLGDLALAAPARGGARAGALALHVERYFGGAFTRNQRAGAGREPPQALTLALDYRTDALVVWTHDGALYARDMPGRGAPHAIQRVATAVGSHVSIAAVLSDDYRGIIVWSEQHGPLTSVYLDQSAVGVRFGAPKLLERFRDADGLAAPAASPRLVRLSNESVMLAWAGVEAGHWVVRTAAIDQRGIGAPGTIAAPAADALLCDLAAGPADDALLLWAVPQTGEGGAPDLQHEALLAARGSDVRPRRTVFGAPEQVAAAGPYSEPSLALDPDSDRALAVWRSEGGALQYAVRSAGAGR